MRSMPCECCQAKRSRKNGLFPNRKKCCRVCGRILCHSCAMQKVCRFCALKDATILEREKLLKLSEEELVEIAEAFGLSLDSEKLLKSEMVHLMMIACRSPNSLKSPPGTPVMSPKNIPPLITLESDTPMITGEKTANHEGPSVDIPNYNSLKKQKKHTTARTLTVYLSSDASEKPAKSASKEKYEENQDSLEKSRMLPPQRTTSKLNPTFKSGKRIDTLSVKELRAVLDAASIDFKGIIDKQELQKLVIDLWDKTDKEDEGNEQEPENINLRESTPSSPKSEFKTNFMKSSKRKGLYVNKTADKEEVQQTCLEENTSQCNLEGEKDSILSKNKKIEGDKKSPDKSKRNLKIDVQATLLPPLKSLSIKDVVSPESIEEMSTRELIAILQNHPSNATGLVLEEGDGHDKWKLAFKVLELWNAEHSLNVQEQLEECKICMESPANCTLLDCGHVVTCYRCAKDLHLCPICRQEVIRVVRLFKS